MKYSWFLSFKKRVFIQLSNLELCIRKGMDSHHCITAANVNILSFKYYYLCVIRGFDPMQNRIITLIVNWNDIKHFNNLDLWSDLKPQISSSSSSTKQWNLKHINYIGHISFFSEPSRYTL